MSATTSRLFQYSKCDPILIPKILLLTRVILKSFQKEKGRFFMPTFCHIFYALVMIYYTLSCFFWHNLLQRQEFWISTTHSPRFVVKSEIYYSSVTIHCYYSLSLFTCYCSWHCSLRNFAYLRGVVPYISSKFLVCLVQDFFPRESYSLWAFLWEISLLTTTSLHLYKACN